MDAKILIAHIEIDHRKHKIRKHRENKQDEFEKQAQDIFLSKMKEFEMQEQEIKRRKTQDSLAYKKFWERQIEEKKLLFGQTAGETTGGEAEQVYRVETMENP